MNADADLLELKALSRWPDVLQEVARSASDEVSENPPADPRVPGDDDLREDRDVRQVKMMAKWSAQIEQLWDRIRGTMERSGIAPKLARTHAALIKKAADDGIDLLTRIRPDLSSAEHLRELDETCIRLADLRRQSRPLLRSADLPLPPFDPERVRRGEEAIARGDPGVDAEEWLNQLRREASQ